MEPIILVIHDTYGPRALEVPLKPCTLGRSRNADLRVVGSFISRIHALLTPDLGLGTFVIFDGKNASSPSTNGLYINRVQVRSHRLQLGDCIWLGPKIELFWQNRSRLGEAEAERLLAASERLDTVQLVQGVPTESTQATFLG